MLEIEYNSILTNIYKKIYTLKKDVWSHEKEMRFASIIVNNLFGKNIVSKKILDIGCGIGIDSVNFAQNGADVIGIDIIKHEQWSEYQSYLDKLSFIEGSFLEVDFDCTFDGVIDNGCLHHQHSKILDNYLNKVYSVLKKDGFFVISTFFNCISTMRYDSEGRIMRSYSIEGLKSLVEKAGFIFLNSHIVERHLYKSSFLICSFKK